MLIFRLPWRTLGRVFGSDRYTTRVKNNPGKDLPPRCVEFNKEVIVLGKFRIKVIISQDKDTFVSSDLSLDCAEGHQNCKRQN